MRYLQGPVLFVGQTLAQCHFCLLHLAADIEGMAEVAHQVVLQQAAAYGIGRAPNDAVVEVTVSGVMLALSRSLLNFGKQASLVSELRQRS